MQQPEVAESGSPPVGERPFDGPLFDDQPFDAATVEAGAWWPGPYGDGDTLGSYAEVTPERRAAALATLDLTREVITVSLGETLSEDYPAWGSRSYTHQLVFSGGDPGPGFVGQLDRPEPNGANRLSSFEERVSFTYNLGSKINGLHHCGVGTAFYGGHRLADLATPTGSRALDTTTWGPPLVTRGFLIDVLTHRLDTGGELAAGPDGAPLLPGGARVTLDELRASVARQGLPPFGPGDAIVIRTGWHRLVHTDPVRYLSANPGVYLAETRWLASFRPALVGADTWCWETTDRAVHHGLVMPCHQELFVRFGIRLGEGLALEDLAARGIDRFVLCHAPLRATGAVSSNTPAIALANLP
jgi:hypothetical protein